MSVAATPWLESLLALLQALQLGLLRLLDLLGLTGRLDGQPLWPWPWRVSAEMLRIDRGHARTVAIALAALGAALLLAALALPWRRYRPWLLAGAAVILGLTPLPAASLLFTEAVPTSFHRSPNAFDAAAIVRGQAVYGAHCAACHGDDGRGEGPRAAQLPMWPPDLTRGLVWQRTDGELFWRIRAGMHDRHGAPTMPGFGATLADAELWAAVDYLHALAAGQSLRRDAAWASPVRLPGFAARRADGSVRRFGAQGGSRLQIVAESGGGAADPLPDPRFDTVLLRRPGSDAPPPGDVCVADGADAWAVFALLTGLAPDQLGGARLLADRAGWLRAVARPDGGQWTDADLVCRAGDGSRATDGDAKPAAAGLDALLARIDAEPVRAVRGGYAH